MVVGGDLVMHTYSCFMYGWWDMVLELFYAHGFWEMVYAWLEVVYVQLVRDGL